MNIEMKKLTSVAAILAALAAAPAMAQDVGGCQQIGERAGHAGPLVPRRAGRGRPTLFPPCQKVAQ